MAYITRADLEAALSKETVVALYDDDRDGVADDAQILKTIARAEAMVNSYLVGFYPVPSVLDPLIVAAATDYAVAFSFERHPEYVRTHGEEKNAEKWKRATATMLRVQAGVQRLPTVEQTTKHAMVGGVAVSSTKRMFVDGSDGSSNSGEL